MMKMERISAAKNEKTQNSLPKGEFLKIKVNNLHFWLYYKQSGRL
jgi:hypothetical protein